MLRRLVIPVNYGMKNIKRIGSVTRTAERGYDWFAGF